MALGIFSVVEIKDRKLSHHSHDYVLLFIGHDYSGIE